MGLRPWGRLHRWILGRSGILLRTQILLGTVWLRLWFRVAVWRVRRVVGLPVGGPLCGAFFGGTLIS
ncbi:hypothetical protein GCM10009771_20360 [Nesterenkonia flava]